MAKRKDAKMEQPVEVLKAECCSRRLMFLPEGGQYQWLLRAVCGKCGKRWLMNADPSSSDEETLREARWLHWEESEDAAREQAELSGEGPRKE